MPLSKSKPTRKLRVNTAGGQMRENLPFLLICGTSHTGKSTLAGELGKALGCNVFSTDRMGRHPGRPWQSAPPHVTEFYEKLSDTAIYTFLLHHHENMWPGIDRFIKDQTQPFILEGSALRPEYLGEFLKHAVCLYGTSRFLRARIHAQSDYTQRTKSLQQVIDKFVERSLQDNAHIHAEAAKLDITTIDVQDAAALADLRDYFVRHGNAK